MKTIALMAMALSFFDSSPRSFKNLLNMLKLPSCSSPFSRFACLPKDFVTSWATSVALSKPRTDDIMQLLIKVQVMEHTYDFVDD